MRSSLIILACFLAGMLGAARPLLPPILLASELALAVLYLLLFLVGVGIGASPQAWHLFRRLSLQMALVPLAAVVGTLAGVAVVSAALPGLAVREALAVGAGFGYYSLSSILVTQLRGEALGVITLLANILREFLTLVLAPLMARYFGKLAPVVSGGATAMDTTLPVIVKVAGTEYAMLAVFNGMVLTLLVPLLISLLL